jgi:hypothetical protein
MSIGPASKNSFLQWGFVLLLLFILILLSSCAYRHYMGLHGPSIKAYPLVHSGFKEDKTCLMCHSPESDAEAPKTSHPKFTGCLKCHNDELKTENGPADVQDKPARKASP